MAAAPPQQRPMAIRPSKVNKNTGREELRDNRRAEVRLSAQPISSNRRWADVGCQAATRPSVQVVISLSLGSFSPADNEIAPPRARQAAARQQARIPGRYWICIGLS